MFITAASLNLVVSAIRSANANLGNKKILSKLFQTFIAFIALQLCHLEVATDCRGTTTRPVDGYRPCCEAETSVPGKNHPTRLSSDGTL